MSREPAFASHCNTVRGSALRSDRRPYGDIGSTAAMIDWQGRHRSTANGQRPVDGRAPLHTAGTQFPHDELRAYLARPGWRAGIQDGPGGDFGACPTTKHGPPTIIGPSDPRNGPHHAGEPRDPVRDVGTVPGEPYVYFRWDTESAKLTPSPQQGPCTPEKMIPGTQGSA